MKIFLTKRALKKYLSIKEYIQEELGQISAHNFELKTGDFLELLQRFPQMGPIEVAAKQIRGFQLTRHTRVFYRIKKEKILILTFFDVRQNPAKKPK